MTLGKKRTCWERNINETQLGKNALGKEWRKKKIRTEERTCGEEI